MNPLNMEEILRRCFMVPRRFSARHVRRALPKANRRKRKAIARKINESSTLRAWNGFMLPSLLMLRDYLRKQAPHV